MWRNAAEKIFGALAIEKLTGVEVQEKELPITVLEDIFLATFDTPALRTAGSHAAIANICKVRLCARVTAMPPPLPPDTLFSPPLTPLTAAALRLLRTSASCWGSRRFTTTTSRTPAAPRR